MSMPRPLIAETRTECKWGHPWTPANVFDYPYGTCRTCRRHYRDPRVIALKERVAEYKSALSIATRHGRDTSEIQRIYDNLLWQMKDLYPPYEAGLARHPISPREVKELPVYTLRCQGTHCTKEFIHRVKTAKYCSPVCRYETERNY